MVTSLNERGDPWAHLSLMDSPHAQTDYTGITTVGTGASTRFPTSRSYHQGQRSYDQISTPMHIYTSRVVHKHKPATLESILKVQEYPQVPQLPGHCSNVRASQNQNSMPIWLRLLQYPGHSCVHKTDGQTDRETDRQTHKVIPIGRPHFHAGH